jgi:putative ABC transport system permease protein
MSERRYVEVLTPAEFRERSRTFWLFGTGRRRRAVCGRPARRDRWHRRGRPDAYASTKEHLNEFATLRAMGSSRRYIYKVILWQALLSAVIGFAIAGTGRRRRRAADRRTGVADQSSRPG